MAFQTITKEGTTIKSGNSSYMFKKSTEMAVGESITGYYLGFEKTIGKYPNIVLQLEDGSLLNLSPSGNLVYMGTEDKEKYTLGQLTRVTKTRTRPSKKDTTKQVGVFKVEQDPENTIEVKVSSTGTEATASNMTDLKAAIARAKAKA